MSQRKSRRKYRQEQRNEVRQDTLPKCKLITAKTDNQKKYIKAINNNKIVFCVGPAGTGKTCIATSMAIYGLLNEDYKRIILTRPLIQAGENTGFLPGDINAKLHPYMLPIYDEIKQYVSHSELKRLISLNTIEVVPFAYMRGRNFHDSFIISDEMQNATASQIKMLLTRIGQNSKMVLTGDYSQSDLPKHNQGGLLKYKEVLSRVNKVDVIELTTSDIVRDPIVAEILLAMENFDEIESQKSIGS